MHRTRNEPPFLRVRRLAGRLSLLAVALSCGITPASPADIVPNLALGAVFAGDGASAIYRVDTKQGWLIRRVDADGHVRDELAQKTFDAQAHRTGGSTGTELPHSFYAQDDKIGLTLDGRRWLWSAAGGLREDGAAHSPIAMSDGEDGPATSASPDGRYDISADGPNLRLEDRGTGRTIALTSDGSWEQPWGRDLAPLNRVLEAHNEHPALPVRALWNAASNRVLTCRLDTRGVPPLWITRQNEPGTHLMASYRYIYPLAGMKYLPQLTRYVIDIPASLAAGHGIMAPVDMPSEEVLYPAPPRDRWLGAHPRIVWTQRGYDITILPNTRHGYVGPYA